MIDETLDRLERRIRASTRTGEDAKSDLLAIVHELRAELAGVAVTHADDARAIAGHAAAAAERVDDDDGAVEESIRGFETAHPHVVGLVRSFLRTLADAGI